MLLVAAVFQPVAGVVFVLDGVLIGAGDGRYLAWGGVVVLAVFAPLALVAVRHAPAGARRWSGCGSPSGVGFMGSRAVVLLHRARGTAWMVTGTERPPVRRVASPGGRFTQSVGQPSAHSSGARPPPLGSS